MNTDTDIYLTDLHLINQPSNKYLSNDNLTKFKSLNVSKNSKFIIQIVPKKIKYLINLEILNASFISMNIIPNQINLVRGSSNQDIKLNKGNISKVGSGDIQVSNILSQYD